MPESNPLCLESEQAAALLRESPLTLVQIPTLSPLALRQRIATLYANYHHRRGPHITLGAALARIKQEHLYKRWGWPSLYHYCRQELELKPAGAESFLISLYHRMTALECPKREMEKWEQTYPAHVLVVATRHCKTRAALQEVLRGDLPTVKARLQTYQKRSRTLVFSPVPRMKLTDAELVEAVFGHLTRQCGLTRDKALLAMALVVKAHMESRSGNRQRFLRRWCRWHGLPESLAAHFFTGEISR